ncbi:MAG: hypothetical protein CO127_09880 [Ignavibacteria bacterium CG_4_9_14_3_um_filter_36_18]|nr:hypothetical protein [Ignavibacteria bacterium]PJA99780.1 MAG: hypothetical protein CO127_09880 [Ignavibacteria bacterium CG_4_9_14_3_um_filter_36_18]
MGTTVQTLEYNFANETTLDIESPPNKELKSFETFLFESATGSIASFWSPRSITNLSKTSDDVYPSYVKIESQSQKQLALLQGEVEKIENDYGLVILEKNGVFEERIFSLDRLKKIDANYVGAKIIISITEEKNSITTTIKKSSEEKPEWASPDEELIRLIQTLNYNK